MTHLNPSSLAYRIGNLEGAARRCQATMSLHLVLGSGRLGDYLNPVVVECGRPRHVRVALGSRRVGRGPAGREAPPILLWRHGHAGANPVADGGRGVEGAAPVGDPDPV